MSIDTILGLAIGAIATFVVIAFIQKRKGGDDLSQEMEKRLNEIFPKVLQNANEQLISMANEKLGAEKREMKTDLDNKRKLIEKMIESVQLELRDSGKTSQSILQQMKDHEKITKDLSLTTDGLRKVLTNNQLRGQFGEQVAEDLLKMAGFVRGVDFDYNKAQTNTSTRPDFSIYLPDKTKINIDVKFPYANLQKSTATEDKEAKKQLMKQFETDVREKIKQITTREYINPEDKTVDFVILFVPNEMIFSYIYEHMNDVWRDAMEKKVVFVGPFSFTALLRMVRQAYENFRYQENIHQMISHIKRFEIEFDKYNEEFNKIGDYIHRLSTQYSQVETTRTKQLVRVVEKIRLEDKSPVKKTLLPPISS
jgi:DNA recombination protein RmuC